MQFEFDWCCKILERSNNDSSGLCYRLKWRLGRVHAICFQGKNAYNNETTPSFDNIWGLVFFFSYYHKVPPDTKRVLTSHRGIINIVWPTHDTRWSCDHRSYGPAIFPAILWSIILHSSYKSGHLNILTANSHDDLFPKGVMTSA